jgi:integrase
VIQQGQVFKLKAKGPDGQPLWAYRYRLEGRGSTRPQVGGFASRAEAQKALRKVLDRLGPGGGCATMTLAELVEQYPELHQAEPVTIAKLRWLLGKATAVLGAKRLVNLSPRDVYMAVDGSGGASIRGDPGAATGSQPGRRLGVDRVKRGEARHPQRAPASREKRPFESWRQIEAVAATLGPVYGPMVVFAAATGLRPSELFGLESRDVDRDAGVIYVHGAYANGRLKHTKTRLSNRAVPLQAKAIDALDRLPRSENEILFPNARGGRIDFRSFGRRHGKPAQRVARIEPLRDLYDLRHTYVTFALRAGIPAFAVSRFIGSSIAMIDRHYGHLAHDSRQHAVSLLDALAYERAVDAAWTSHRHLQSRSTTAGRVGVALLPVVAWTRWTPRIVSVASSENERS